MAYPVSKLLWSTALSHLRSVAQYEMFGWQKMPVKPSEFITTEVARDELHDLN